MKKYAWILAALLLSLPLNAQSPDESTRPRLLVLITADPLSPQWIQTYRDHLSLGGFRKLSEEGLVFTRAATHQFLSSRSVTTATIHTGAPASVHGIVGTSWYDRLKRQEVYCTEDYQSTDFTNFGSGIRHSAHQLLVTTIGQQIAHYAKGKNISISLEPDAAILSGGHQTNGTYWLDSQTGDFTSNSRFIRQLPQWVIDFNGKNLPDQFLSEDWDMLKGAPYPEAHPDQSDFEYGLFGDVTNFPYRLTKMQKSSTEGPYEVIRHIPAGNKLLAEFALTAIEREQLGQDAATDLLSIAFSGFSKIISLYGYDSQEGADALVRLDMEIQNLLFVLDREVGKENVLVVLTGTHGSSWNVDMAMEQHLPAGKFRVRNAIALLNSYLSAIYGENYWIESYINQQIYLDQTLIDKNKIPIGDIQDQAARFLLQFRGVARTFTGHQLSALQLEGQPGSPVLEQYYGKRSGDVLISLQPGWIQDDDVVSDHLSVYPYDQQVPLMFWGYRIQPGVNDAEVTLRQITPTLCDLCRIPYPTGARSESLLPYLVYSFESSR